MFPARRLYYTVHVIGSIQCNRRLVLVFTRPYQTEPLIYVLVSGQILSAETHVSGVARQQSQQCAVCSFTDRSKFLNRNYLPKANIYLQ